MVDGDLDELTEQMRTTGITRSVPKRIHAADGTPLSAARCPPPPPQTRCHSMPLAPCATTPGTPPQAAHAAQDGGGIRHRAFS
jgi:hypothetical protein